MSIPRAGRGVHDRGCFAIGCPEPDEELGRRRCKLRPIGKERTLPPLEFSWHTTMGRSSTTALPGAGQADGHVAIIRTTDEIAPTWHVYLLEGDHQEGADAFGMTPRTLDGGRWRACARSHRRSRPNKSDRRTIKRSGSPDTDWLTDFGQAWSAPATDGHHGSRFASQPKPDSGMSPDHHRRASLRIRMPRRGSGSAQSHDKHSTPPDSNGWGAHKTTGGPGPRMAIPNR